jgi:hemerythrin
VIDFLFDWTSEFNTNIEKLDTHHQQFFRIGRDCEQLIQNKCNSVEDKQLLSIVAGLKEFITYHFYEEEGMMLDYAYPDIEKHKESHRQFAKKVSEINLSALKLNPVEELKKIREMIQEKVFWHILSEDKKMAEYVVKVQKKMLEDVAALENKKDEFEEKYGFKICELDLSTAYLIRNQNCKGNCILIFKNKVKDLTRLAALERNVFFADLSKLSKAIHKVFSPDGINYGSSSDMEERFHMHVVPQYVESNRFASPFSNENGEVLLSDEEGRDVAEKIRIEIGKLPL